MNKVIKKLLLSGCIGIISGNMLFSSVPVIGAEGIDTAMTENYESTAESIFTGETSGIIGETANEASKSIGDENVSDAQPLKAESWRYQNGNPVGPTDKSYYNRAKSSAWTKVNGKYVNSKGEVIEGALFRGIDVSQWQGNIDWEKVKNDDVSFAIIRCGYAGNKTKYDDPYWKRNADECTRLGIPFGTYLYSYAQSAEDAEDEAQHVLRLIKGYRLEYPIYYDLEDSSIEVLTAKEKAEIAKTFCDIIKSAGYEVQIYANTDWWTTQLTDNYFSSFGENKWVAEWGNKCNYKGGFSIWQCTNSGIIDGINGNVDIDLAFTNKYDRTVQVQAFITRLYELVLGRDPDTVGISEWTDVLMNQKESGAKVAQNFTESVEFIGKNVDNKTYLDILYKTFLNREPDEIGQEEWLERLECGFSRTYVLKGFAESSEFTEICQKYGIIRGTIFLSEPRDQKDNVTEFISRCYKIFLGREPDAGGLNDWASIILNNTQNAKNIPYGFVFSDEMNKKMLTDEAFITCLYRGLFDREPDFTGLNEWKQCLMNGQSRISVYNGFINSIEFKELLDKFQF